VGGAMVQQFAQDAEEAEERIQGMYDSFVESGLNYLTQEQALSRLVAGTAKALWIDAQNFQALSWDEWTALPVTADDRVIGTVKGKIRAPSIILLQRYDKVPMITLSFSLRNL
jgi:hypothetical protein